MAKSRRNRGGASQRRDPISKPVKPPSDPELAALREAKILPVIQNLRKADPKSRSSAATAITNLIQDTRCRKLLLREHIVHTVLTQTLTDAAWESRAAGWGILQVLAQEEEPDFCVHLFRSDILTAMAYAARTVGEKLVSREPEFARLPRGERVLVASITASLVALLTALAEAGDEILEAISSNATVTDLLFLLIIHGGRGQTCGGGGGGGHEDAGNIASLCGDALACLMILSEDNGDLAAKLVTNAECYQALLALKDQVSGDGVLACATLHNVFAALETLKAGPPVLEAAHHDDSLLIPTLAKTIAAVEEVGDAAAAANGTEGGWSNPIEQQQLALETLASIGTALISARSQVSGPATAAANKKRLRRGAAQAKADDEDTGMEDEAEAEAEMDEMDEAEDEMDDAKEAGGHGDDDKDGPEEKDDDDDDDDQGSSSSGPEDEMDQDEMEADMDMVTGADDAGQDAPMDDMPVLKALIQLAIPHLLRIASLQPTNDDALRLQGHALSALNNTAWSVSLVDVSDPQSAAIQQAWLPVARTLWQHVITPILASDTADVHLATQVTGLAWALARTLAGQPTTPDTTDHHHHHHHHRKFISLYHATRTMTDPQPSQDPFQRLGVKCIGVLGQLALHPCPAPLNREIASFLLALLAALPDTPPADAVEALNQLLDIYANEDFPYDAPVFWADDFLPRFEALVPSAKAMAKAVDKKTQPELRTRAEEAVLNLRRFVAYKKRHRPAS
ncbi:hypothetical protein E4U42_002161 [Claviceps africana]|uniref:SYO1-like TPR repeats domain-containing protein n=1 Tax=Claviceps africana TaxID=83212 RepID=A0A8K0J9V6_9HYPO|nr:hypothetical protein E4U42_002161 [Claviceps africana]